MKFTAVALAGLATVAMASPAAEAGPAPAPAPQPEAAAEPAFSSWGKKYNPHLWNGWGDAPGQVYRREANPAFSSWGKKYNPHLWNGWGDAPGQVYKKQFIKLRDCDLLLDQAGIIVCSAQNHFLFPFSSLAFSRCRRQDTVPPGMFQETQKSTAMFPKCSKVAGIQRFLSVLSTLSCCV
jgi:hypothetical protein